MMMAEPWMAPGIVDKDYVLYIACMRADDKDKMVDEFRTLSSDALGAGLNRLFRIRPIGSHPWKWAQPLLNYSSAKKGQSGNNSPSSFSVLNKLHKLLKTQQKPYKKLLSQSGLFSCILKK